MPESGQRAPFPFTTAASVRGLAGSKSCSRVQDAFHPHHKSTRSCAAMSRPVSERTPLLRSTSQNHKGTPAFTQPEVTAAEVAQQGEGAAPQFPESRKSRSRSQDGVDGDDDDDDDDDATTISEAGDLVKFEENGKLQGVGIWRFRCVFGGILLGYFVRPSDLLPVAGFHAT